MNKPRDLKGRYIRTNSQNFVKIPTNLYGGCHVPSHPPERKHDHYRYLTDAGASSSKFIEFCMYFDGFSILQRSIDA